MLKFFILVFSAIVILLIAFISFAIFSDLESNTKEIKEIIQLEEN